MPRIGGISAHFRTAGTLADARVHPPGDCSCNYRAGPRYAGGVIDDTEGEGWRLVRSAADARQWVSIDTLIPDADWFWLTLQRECIPECCGLDAYDFSAESVAWACAWGTTDPGGIIDKTPMPGDVPALVFSLREAADAIRMLDVDAVSANLFNNILTPGSYANLLEDLATKAEQARPLRGAH
jgi:hypothetical protein